MKKRFISGIVLLTTMILLSGCGKNVSSSTISNDTLENTNSEIEGLTVGEIVTFGTYEQDGNFGNGKEPIEWEVLSVEGNKALLISKYVLDCQPYNNEDTDVTWETCTLRTWLNNDFKNAAFSSAEQAKIPTVTIVNKNNPRYGTAGGSNTNDQIFCLSLEEMESYFGNYSYYKSEYMYGFNQNLICTPTQYAETENNGEYAYTITEVENNGAYAYIITEDDYNSSLKDKGYTRDVIGRRVSYWWLRSPGDIGICACGVGVFGDAGAGCLYHVTYDRVGVRPALYVEF